MCTGRPLLRAPLDTNSRLWASSGGASQIGAVFFSIHGGGPLARQASTTQAVGLVAIGGRSQCLLPASLGVSLRNHHDMFLVLARACSTAPVQGKV